MTIQTWEEYLNVTKDKTPIAKGVSGVVFFEDYNLPDGYWRYTWTNFTLNKHPEFVEVNLMESEDDCS